MQHFFCSMQHNLLHNYTKCIIKHIVGGVKLSLNFLIKQSVIFKSCDERPYVTPIKSHDYRGKKANEMWKQITINFCLSKIGIN